MRRGVPSRALLVGLAALAGSTGACTDASLFGTEFGAAVADRVTLAGRVCAEDTATARLPVRVVLLADVAQGPLFASFDPGATRIGLLGGFMQSALTDPSVEVAVVSFGGRSRKLAPIEGNFTRNPGELLNAVNQLSLSEPCAPGADCRDYLEGLRTARALIEGDLAENPRGLRAITQYVIIFITAGEQDPLALNVECCDVDDAACLDQDPQPSVACQEQRQQDELLELIEATDEAGGLGVKLHVIQLAAEEIANVNERLQRGLVNMAFTGNGSFRRVNTITALAPQDLDLLRDRTSLRAKGLLVANRNARPTPEGPVVDSDADGLDDASEREQGTDPVLRDSDGDSIGDLVEILVGFDPLVADEPLACNPLLRPERDRDLDGLTDCEEAVLGTDDSLVDSDGDGMPDVLEVQSFTDYVDRDGERDADGDGIPNSDEVRTRTDPRATDSTAQLLFGYRYEVEDEGVTRELFPLPFEEMTGVEILSTSAGTTAGLGTLRFDVDDQTLAWQDAEDQTVGVPVDVSEAGEYELPSSSFAEIQGETGKFIRVRVDPIELPFVDLTERVRVIFRDRQCLNYIVRNVRLMDTRDLDDGLGAGANRLFLYFGQAPAGKLQQPGPYRLSEVPVSFFPPSRREPSGAVIRVRDDEFVRPRIFRETEDNP